MLAKEKPKRKKGWKGPSGGYVRGKPLKDMKSAVDEHHRSILLTPEEMRRARKRVTDRRRRRKRKSMVKAGRIVRV